MNSGAAAKALHMWRAHAFTMIDTICVEDLTVLRARPARCVRGPVLFVHGFFADASIFAGWLELFAAWGVPAYALNLRGRAGSRSTTILGRASIEDFTADAATVARQLGTPDVVGHSMGGLIAQRLAERGLARSTVLIAPAPPAGISLLSAAVVFREFAWLPAMLRGGLVRPTAHALCALVLNHVDAADRLALLRRFIPDSGRAARELAFCGVAVDVQRVRCPVLVITGDDDRFIPARVARRVAARYGASLDVRTAHGHMLPIEPGWDVLAAEVLRWIESSRALGSQTQSR